MGVQSNYQVTQTFTVTELTKHHSKQLVPTCKMLNIPIAVVFANVVVKLSSVQKYGKLRKNVSVLIHMQPLNYGCKSRNSNPFHFKTPCK